MNANCAATPQKRLAALFAFIEDSVCGDVTLEMLAEAGGLSRFQLIRLFSRFCGVTPMDYVRARRLARSLPALLDGARVLDVALEYGFAFEQSYIRAFRAQFGVTPARFRRQRESVVITEPPSLEGLTLSASGMLGAPLRVYRHAFALRGAVRAYNYADNLLSGAPLLDGLAHNGGGVYTGACRPRGAATFTHDYMVEDARGGGECTWHYGGGAWALFRYIGLHPLDAEGARRFRLLASLVMRTWFDERRLPWDGSFIEVTDGAWLGEDYCEIEVYCPIE